MAIMSAISSFKNQKALFTPSIDFLLIGGLGLIFIMTFNMLPRQGPIANDLFLLIFGLQFFINFPHFAASYQLLYENIGHKLKDKNSPKLYRARILNAAFIVPVILVSVLAYSFLTLNQVLLGYMVNFMFFTVAWHYAKQGFGMLMVISALNKVYFSAKSRMVLLIHTHSIWILAWWLYNQEIEESKVFHEIPYYLFDITKIHWLAQMFMQTVILLVIISTIMILFGIISRVINKQKFPPINGVVGYVSSIYIWLFFIGEFHPVYIAIVPALHSLQYLLFVAKYKKAECQQFDNSNQKIKKGVRHFFTISYILGSLGFYFIPHIMNWQIEADAQILGLTFFTFSFHVFINIHHYFIDNVIWKKENKDVGKYLFS